MEAQYWTCPYCGVNVFPTSFQAAEQFETCSSCGRDRYDEPEPEPEPDPESDYWNEQARLGLIDVDPARITKRKRK